MPTVDALAREAQADAQVGRCAGPPTGRSPVVLAHPVDDRVLGLAAPRTACGAATPGDSPDDVDRERAVRRDVLFPRHLAQAAYIASGSRAFSRRASAARGSRCATAGRRGRRSPAARRKLTPAGCSRATSTPSCAQFGRRAGPRTLRGQAAKNSMRGSGAVVVAQADSRAHEHARRSRGRTSLQGSAR